MKKSMLILVPLLVSLAVGVQAERQGAVKVPFDPDVGWVVLNTTADGRLVASAHLDGGLPDEEFAVNIRVRYEDQSIETFEDVATLVTNAEGKGNVQVEVAVDPPPGSETLRRVAFRVRRAPAPLYLAVAWDVPLK